MTILYDVVCVGHCDAFELNVNLEGFNAFCDAHPMIRAWMARGPVVEEAERILAS